MKRGWMLGLVLTAVALLMVAPVNDAEAAVITSWDNANQRGGSLASGAAGANIGGTLDYDGLGQLMVARGHTVLPGLSSVTPAGLAGVDVFFWGTSSTTLSVVEAAALSSFVSSGGSLILETNSAPSEAASANSAYQALGLGNRVLGTGSGVNGTFLNVASSALVGPLGDLRNQSFNSSLARNIDPTGHLLIGTNGGTTSWVEFAVGSGAVLGVGDPYGFDLFGPNPNNAAAYLNFIENNHPVPEPGTLGLLLTGGIALFTRARRRRR